MIIGMWLTVISRCNSFEIHGFPLWRLIARIAAALLLFPFLALPARALQASILNTGPGIGVGSSILSETEFDRIEQSTIYFKPSPGAPPLKPLKTNLYDLSFLGSLKAPAGGSPYFLFSGKPCENCQVDREIYSIRASAEKPIAFVYPGKILDPATKKLLFESRAFFGQCLPKKRDVYVVYQTELVDRRRQRRLMNSVFIAEAGREYFQENLIEKRPPSIRPTLQLVKSKKCKEIDGRNRFMLTKPLDLHPHDNGNSDDTDEPDEVETPPEVTS